jgi:hypothetical protein
MEMNVCHIQHFLIKIGFKNSMRTCFCARFRILIKLGSILLNIILEVDLVCATFGEHDLNLVLWPSYDLICRTNIEISITFGVPSLKHNVCLHTKLCYFFKQRRYFVGTPAGYRPWALLQVTGHGNSCKLQAVGTPASYRPWALLQDTDRGHSCFVTGHGHYCKLQAMETPASYRPWTLLQVTGHGHSCKLQTMETPESYRPW